MRLINMCLATRAVAAAVTWQPLTVEGTEKDDGIPSLGGGPATALSAALARCVTLWTELRARLRQLDITVADAARLCQTCAARTLALEVRLACALRGDLLGASGTTGVFVEGPSLLSFSIDVSAVPPADVASLCRGVAAAASKGLGRLRLLQTQAERAESALRWLAVTDSVHGCSFAALVDRQGRSRLAMSARAVLAGDMSAVAWAAESSTAAKVTLGSLPPNAVPARVQLCVGAFASSPSASVPVDIEMDGEPGAWGGEGKDEDDASERGCAADEAADAEPEDEEAVLEPGSGEKEYDGLTDDESVLTDNLDDSDDGAE